MPEKKKIIIAAHTFPPTPGIGGRRWAKFAKYFLRAGHSVTALSADIKSNAESNWNRDVEGVEHITYAHNFPEVLSTNPQSVAAKLKYKLALKSMQRKSKGTPYDRALLDKEAFQNALSSQIEKDKPDVVVVTGAPFLLLAYAAELRNKFPETFFVADFRDPWTWGEAYGYSELDSKRLKYEQGLQKFVCEQFDFICSPWPEIIEQLKILYPSQSSKMQVLPHGYDADEMIVGQVAMSDQSSEKVLLYGGTIYQGFEKRIEDLSRLILDNSVKCRVEIYTDDKLNLKGIDGVEILDPLPSAQFFQKAREADWLLFLIPEHAKDGVPTKLYEYAALGKPVLAFGFEGKLSRFIEEKKLGRFVKDLSEVPAILESGFKRDHSNLWYREFSIESIAKDFMSMIKKM